MVDGRGGVLSGSVSISVQRRRPSWPCSLRRMGMETSVRPAAAQNQAQAGGRQATDQGGKQDEMPQRRFAGQSPRDEPGRARRERHPQSHDQQEIEARSPG